MAITHPFRMLLTEKPKAAAARLREVVLENDCNMRAVARDLDVTSATLYRWIQRDHRLRQAVNEARNVFAQKALKGG